MRNIKIMLCLAIILALPLLTTANSQDNEYVVKRVSAIRSQYLTDNSTIIISAIDQDENGMIWLSSLSGLYYFDNYKFYEYRNTDMLNSRIISVLCAGNSLYFGTMSGLSIVDVNSGLVCNKLINNKINTIVKGFDDKIMVGTDKGLFIFDENKNDFVLVECFALPVNDIFFCPDDESCWLATNNGVFHIDSECSVSNFGTGKIKTIALVDTEHVFCGSPEGLFTVDFENDTLRRVLINDKVSYISVEPDVTDVVAFDDDEILIGTNGNGLYRYNIFEETILHYTKYGDKNNSISDDYINNIFLDDSGRFWISTSLGVNFMMKDYSDFTSINLFYNGTHRLPVRCFEKFNEEEFFIGTDEGVLVFNKLKSLYSKLNDYFMIDNVPFMSMNVNAMCFIDNRYLWVGSRYDGLYCFDVIEKKVTDYHADDRDVMFYDIIYDGHGNIWLATDNGLYKMRLSDNNLTHFVHDAADPHSIIDNGLFDLLIDGGYLYITSNKGLSRYSFEADVFENFVPDSEDMTLYNLTKGDNGLIYIGSYRNGVVIFDTNNDEFKMFDNLSENRHSTAFNIILDHDGNLWVSTMKGLMKYNISNDITTIYSVMDGLQGNEFTMNGAFIDEDGTLFFGGFGGFIMFAPKKIKFETTVPKILFTRFKSLTGKELVCLNNEETIMLPRGESTFGIEFSAYNLNKLNRTSYKYMMEGYDDKWRECKAAAHSAEYYNIPSGTYTFMLYASNEAGISNATPYYLTIVVKPIWYATAAFKISIVLLISIIVFSIVFSMIKKERRKSEVVKQISDMEKKMYELKGKALQLQMNPHFLFNTLNSIQSFILVNDSKNASIYLSRFAKLMRRVLNNANRDKVPLGEELEAIRLYLDLEALRLNGRFTYNVEIDSRINVKNVEVASMLLQPFVENAVIHGLAYKANDGKLSIEVNKIDERRIMFVIEDNGIGRERAKQIRAELGRVGKSYATSITEQRLEILSKISSGEYYVRIIDLYGDDGAASGTRVEINMLME
ncbi:MAG: histidine kinase [Candidatus Limimorpha sp.]